MELKHRIKTAQVKAALSVNTEMIVLYWEIGKTISDKQNNEGWGSKIVDRLANDLKISFPDLKGFSPRNLKYMKKFAQTYPDFEFMQQLAAQIPWIHNCILIDKVLQRIGAARRGPGLRLGEVLSGDHGVFNLPTQFEPVSKSYVSSSVALWVPSSIDSIVNPISRSNLIAL